MSIQIGQGGTYVIGSDRYPVTVTSIKGTRMTVTFDSFDRTENGKGANITPDPDGRVIKLTLRKDGIWREQGQKCGFFTFDGRRAYLDPCF